MLPTASPRGEELQFGGVGVCLACTSLCCGMTLSHLALDGAWRAGHTEQASFAFLREEGRSTSQVSLQRLMPAIPQQF